MQVITISGKLYGNCEVKTDKNGHNYIRFKVACKSDRATKENNFNIYRCYFYNTAYADLKDGDTVFLSGDLEASIETDSQGKTWLNQTIYVRQFAR